MRREHRLRSARPRMVGSWSPQSFSSMLMVSSMSSGLAADQAVMYWYSDFLRTTSWASDAAQLITWKRAGLRFSHAQIPQFILAKQRHRRK